MDAPIHLSFISGAIAAGYIVAAAFFLRFWARSRDGLFLAFAGAFALMAINQSLPVVLGIPREEQSGIYLLRLAAFILIIGAVLRKNLGSTKD
ncbi:DUF5985 family protein [Phenylobacterium sp. LH3H17]|uniref:DUF5985 family protein n=1 Tax=Phenylobacterium sp. LH3H17 TaxID=2903901 RepID=UPI0020C96283|nr:DUF5985 family protein [Phenylobacterium sp. LH3H17]UTP41112.1 DUF5985 family protein [Phenylobacterium sp. LH3H17]